MRNKLGGRALSLLASSIILGLTRASAQSPDALLNKLIQKGILTEKEAQEVKAETQTNALAAPAAAESKWKISDSVKSLNLYGDVRLRYEYRGADNVAGAAPNDFFRERFRYAVRLGLRGDLVNDFYYGLRVETSANPRSTWVTMADDSNPTPSAKNSDTIGLSQFYLGWKPEPWVDLTVGRMPNPLYTTPMVWDPDINPEGAAERFKQTVRGADLFATFGQFIYQDTNPDVLIPSSDTFILAWQLGATIKVMQDVSLKIAPVLYNYTGVGQNNGLNTPFSGQGTPAGANPNNTLALNQNGINDLLVFETPAELNFKIGGYNSRLFGDFALNLEGDRRARSAAAIAALPAAFTGEDKAYQIGLAFGNLGLVYGQTAKAGAWEARAYWQHLEQYAADVNLIDSDFFEGRGNLEGIYSAFAYSFTDAIIGTIRYGHADRINPALGTGGNNPDLPGLNPIKNYNIFQFDLTWKF